MSIDWENILPEKWSTDEPHCDAFNRCRYESLNALKAAEARGEICKPLSVEEIEAILFEDDPQGARTPHGQAEAIHRAMTNKEGCMNLYLLEQNINGGYDTYDSAVVAAESEDEARN